MKHLANCTPTEFLVQTNKIRKAVANWLSLTKIMDIRKNLPKLEDGATDAEKQEAVRKQAKKNLSAIFDSCLEEHPQETAELLGMMCFVEPKDLDNHKMTEFMGAFAEIINCPEVISFFISLAQLEKLDIFGSAKA